MVPAAAVIPSPGAFSYVAAVKTLVAVFSESVSLWENRSVHSRLAAVQHSKARHRESHISYGVHGGAWLVVFLGDRWNRMIQEGPTGAKAANKRRPVGQGRKCKDRRWLETVLFYALNDTIIIGGVVLPISEKSRFQALGEVWLQDWNLKELTERYHKTWSLRLNLTQHAKFTGPRCYSEQQIESSFAIWQVVVHGRS